MKIKRCNGYSLIELLITLTICGILAAALLPVFSRPRENCQRTPSSICKSNLKQIGLEFL